ncbi:phosphomannomutase [Swingsia samuiensis]|uniref:Phosphomannomutase n=2 Tax=Swingsia samuiensis TaxID=1293412 RepID=A0A4Y6UMR2_9PROT|nr:phosphomannomutase [Swingsia samuiensis]
MEKSNVKFGTSGARGLVSSMTDEVCFLYTVGYLQYLSKIGMFSTGSNVAFAGDLRPSTPRILKACLAAILYMKGQPVFCGFVPTPALCAYAFHNHIPSFMVTGSHIPDDRNGIKFNTISGEFLKNNEQEMLKEDVQVPQHLFDLKGALKAPPSLPNITNIIPFYIARYQKFFGSNALKGLNLGVYQHSAVGRDILIQIIEALGGLATALGRSDTFIPVDTEAVRPVDIQLAHQWASENHFDAILTTDGDSDRPLLADHTGEWLRGDVLGIITAQFLKAQAVSTPINSNTALEKATFAHTINRTKIGSPFVIEAMMHSSHNNILPSVGYEANGGFLLGSDLKNTKGILPALPTRDAVLPLLCALVSAKNKNMTLRHLLKTIPPRFTASDRLQDIPTKTTLRYLDTIRANTQDFSRYYDSDDITHIDETDGLRFTFENDDIIHLRPSGNAPELRIYTESSPQEAAQSLLSKTKNIIKSALKNTPQNAP